VAIGGGERGGRKMLLADIYLFNAKIVLRGIFEATSCFDLEGVV
jgi:hypothetical protein